MPGLMWLDSSHYQSAPLCLTFIRGTTEDAVFTAFGANPAEALPDDLPTLRVGRSGEWLVVVEENIPPHGVRPEVLRRLPPGTEAVSLYRDIGKLNHEFAHTVDGQIVSAVTTTVPPHWYGSAPERLESLARELAADDDRAAAGAPPDMEVLLALAEGVFGLSLDEADLDRSWPQAHILPALRDLPPEPARDWVPGVGDPLIDARLAHATQDDLIRVLGTRLPRLINDTGLGGYRELAAAAGRALTHGGRHVDDDDQVGLALRELAWHQERAELDLVVARDHLTVPEAELQARIRRGKAAFVLRLTFAGRYGQALVNELVVLRQSWHPGTWRQQALDDLASIPVPDFELAVAERVWQATRHLPDPRGMTDIEPVCRHIQRLLDGGMDIDRIAALGGTTPVGIDLLLSGKLAQISGYQARKLLTVVAEP
jgi:hypothetical protein